MKTYYTKCGRQFKKSSTAEVTGYKINEEVAYVDAPPYAGQITDDECRTCSFVVDVAEGWGEKKKHIRFECRAGSQEPNHKTEWAGSVDDKNTIRIHSLDRNFMEEIRQFCVDHPELGASYLADNMPDCRRTLTINCSANKKGIVAKKELIKKFFPDKERTPVKAVGKAMGMENYKRGILSGLEKMKNNNIEERAVSENTVLDIVDSKEIVSFDYSAVDEDTAAFLQQKEVKITQVRMMSVMTIGKELKESFDKLSKLPYGSKTEFFNNWVESIGISSRHARRYIDAFDYVRKNFPNVETAEQIQPSLLFAISKPSAPPELQEQVISGDISTHKQYKELEEKLKKAEKEAETKQQLYETISKSYDRLEKTNHEHYEKAKKLEEELEKAKEQLLEAQSSGDNEEAERLKQLLQDTESELQDSKQEIEELELQLNDSTEIATAVVEVEKVPDEVREELEALRNSTFSTEISIEVKTMLKILNSNILSLGRLLSTVKEHDHITTECKSYIKQIKDNMSLLKKISLENLNKDLFDFIKDYNA